MSRPETPALDRSPGSDAKLHGPAAVRLGVGIVLLEFATAISTFVASTLLPQIERDLAAQSTLPLLVAGTTVGMFIALPLATRITGRWSPHAVLSAGLLLSLIGSVIAAAAPDPWLFAAGRLLAGFASGVLAVFGIGATIQHLADSFRLKIITAMSAMWLLPALMGPTATLGLEHLIGWRLTLLAPLPLMVVGRLLVVRAVPPTRSDATPGPPPRQMMLVPLGVAAFTVLSAFGQPALGTVGLALAGVGFLALMPSGTARFRRGTPSALAGLTLFGAGYFGALGLITLLLTHTYQASGWQAGIALSAPQAAWSLASLAAPRIAHLRHLAGYGLSLTAASTGAVALLGLLDGPLVIAVIAWTLGGAGVGLAYPQLYLRATTTGSRYTAAQLATAAITTESFGGLVGTSAGAAVAAASDALGTSRGDAFAWAYAGFAVVLGLAAIAGTRSPLQK